MRYTGDSGEVVDVPAAVPPPLEPVAPPQPPPAPTVSAVPAAGGSEGEAHRGLPQAGETREDVGPIVEPHPQDDGPARPAPPGAASVDTPLPVGGAGTGAGVAASSKPGEAWRELLRFFWHRVPEVTHKLAALRNGLPRVVG